MVFHGTIRYLQYMFFICLLLWLEPLSEVKCVVYLNALFRCMFYNLYFFIDVCIIEYYTVGKIKLSGACYMVQVTNYKKFIYHNFLIFLMRSLYILHFAGYA